jgi:hypothetical protein
MNRYFEKTLFIVKGAFAVITHKSATGRAQARLRREAPKSPDFSRPGTQKSAPKLKRTHKGWERFNFGQR